MDQSKHPGHGTLDLIKRLNRLNLIRTLMNHVCTRKNCNLPNFYVDDILLIGNDIGVLTSIKSWLAKQFDMKDLGEANYILGIKLLRDRKNKTLALSQTVYIDKIMARFSMKNFKTGLLPFRHGITFSKDQSPKTSEEIEKMRRVPYAKVWEVSCMLCFVLGQTSILW